MNKKEFKYLPKQQLIDDLINEYKITGKTKTDLLLLKDAILDYVLKDGAIVEMSSEAFELYQTNFAENKKLELRIENMGIWEVVVKKVKNLWHNLKNWFEDLFKYSKIENIAKKL